MKLPRLSVAIAAILLWLSACANEPGPESTGPNRGNAGQAPVSSATPLPDSAFKAQLSVMNPPKSMKAGQEEIINVLIKNASNITWPSHGRPGDGFYQVNLGNTWLDRNAQKVESRNYIRSGLPGDVKPGEQVEVPLKIIAPESAGDYILELDMVQEMVDWFGAKGSQTLRLGVKVEPA